jgi:type III secretion protein V
VPHEKVEKPLDQQPAWWVPVSEQKRLVQLGVPFLEPVKLASYHISLILRRYSGDFIGLQETRSLITSMEQDYGEIAREVQRVIPPQKIAEVLQRLVQEDISIRNLRVIFQALIEWGGKEKDSVLLTEYVRVALKRYISFKFSGGQNILVAYLLEPAAEETLRKAIRQTSAGSFLALEPAAAKRFVDEIKAKADARADAERRPVLLTSMDIRRYTRKLIEMDLPNLPVLSHQELTEDLNVQPIGRIALN